MARRTGGSVAAQRKARVLRRASTSQLREDIRKALSPDRRSVLTADTKDWIRSRHSAQREEVLGRMRPFLEQHETHLLRNFASGHEVDPARISPVITQVESTHDVLLFRYAALHWSVPVSGGFGRRTRFIVRDAQNDKVIGIFALSDPVYNLSSRDQTIGWTDLQKRLHLYRVLDASVIGALQPYSLLLGGKLVALCAISSRTLDLIERKYRGRRTVISKRIVNPRPVLITTTSALGRSSIYNRLVGNGRRLFDPVGWTKGYGHFQVPNPLFERVLELMDDAGIKKARSYAFGSGPNWKMRALRMGLEYLGLDAGLLRHGIARQVYLAPTASNWRAILRGEHSRARWFADDLEKLSAHFRDRWAVPRSIRNPEYGAFDVETLRLLDDSASGQEAVGS